MRPRVLLLLALAAAGLFVLTRSKGDAGPRSALDLAHEEEAGVPPGGELRELSTLSGSASNAEPVGSEGIVDEVPRAALAEGRPKTRRPRLRLLVDLAMRQSFRTPERVQVWILRDGEADGSRFVLPAGDEVTLPVDELGWKLDEPPALRAHFRIQAGLEFTSGPLLAREARADEEPGHHYDLDVNLDEHVTILRGVALFADGTPIPRATICAHALLPGDHLEEDPIAGVQSEEDGSFEWVTTHEGLQVLHLRSWEDAATSEMVRAAPGVSAEGLALVVRDGTSTSLVLETHGTAAEWEDFRIRTWKHEELVARGRCGKTDSTWNGSEFLRMSDHYRAWIEPGERFVLAGRAPGAFELLVLGPKIEEAEDELLVSNARWNFPLHAPSDLNRLRIDVVEQHVEIRSGGAPLRGARLSLIGEDGEVLVGRRRRNAWRVRLHLRPEQSYRARIEKDGFRTVTRELTTEGRAQDDPLVIELERAED